MRLGLVGWVAAACWLAAHPAAAAAAAIASAAVEPALVAPPTAREVELHTRPLIRPRLRLPDSLQGFVVQSITPLADDPSRFAVTVQFRARTPFGAVTGHTAKFRMRRAITPGLWIVTAD